MLVLGAALVAALRAGTLTGTWWRGVLLVLFWLAALGVLQAQGHT